MMTVDFREDAPAFLDFNSYGEEASPFEREVYRLILNKLTAGLAHLSAVADRELADIKDALDKATDDEIENHLMDEHTGVMSNSANKNASCAIWRLWRSRPASHIPCASCPGQLNISRRDAVDTVMTMEKRIPSRHTLWQISSWAKRVISIRAFRPHIPSL
jgi:hypothetical protein